MVLYGIKKIIYGIPEAYCSLELPSGNRLEEVRLVLVFHDYLLT